MKNPKKKRGKEKQSQGKGHFNHSDTKRKGGSLTEEEEEVS